MAEKYIMLSLEDAKIKKIAEVLGNKTCKRILDFLAEISEASETDISKSLGLPVNTIEYNIKKLEGCGLVEKSKNFFWSRKGKKIGMYKLAKKHIVISHKTKPSYSKLKSIVPVVLISGILAFTIRMFYSLKAKTPVLEAKTEEAFLRAAESAAGATETAGTQNIILQADKIFALPAWIWFLAGAFIALLVLLIINWRKL